MSEKVETLKIIDDSKGLTRDDLGALRELAKFWRAGKIVVVVVLAAGTASVAVMNIWDLFARGFHK